MEIYEGIPAAPGIVSGPAYLFSVEDIEVPRVKIDDPAVEFARFESALSVAEKEIEDIRERAQTDVGTEEAAIFGAHALFMKDPELIKNTRSRIEENKINAEAAWMDAIKEMAAKLDEMEDEYFKARAIDVRDHDNNRGTLHCHRPRPDPFRHGETGKGYGPGFLYGRRRTHLAYRHPGQSPRVSCGCGHREKDS
jgi:phosphoenolpyruvate-protein kinase (PTS system EI component)